MLLICPFPQDFTYHSRLRILESHLTRRHSLEATQLGGVFKVTAKVSLRCRPHEKNVFKRSI